MSSLERALNAHQEAFGSLLSTAGPVWNAGSILSLGTIPFCFHPVTMQLTAMYCQKGVAQAVPYMHVSGILLMEPYSRCTQFHSFLDH